ncbi:uracil phosphoribosyltransferase [Roseococcus pinisoli]|uniref:Uracil phosphoribosyltransferase n=1 Tax=Roseococcus pinisoli TaxID=2835040 RepID=A0ABS5QCH8_9PROT|nr:uracil phosphoribosyltransferase [Roseococcus pinisoli]MBS7811133.1 uracil phosphoribosyltransferase [Roseococcus pinisoli]
MSTPFHIPDHALLRAKLTRLRRRETDTVTFRRALAEVGAILTSEALRDLDEVETGIETPVGPMRAPALAAPEPCLVAILRAGLGLLEGARMVLPEAPVGHLGLVRDEHTLRPTEYVVRLPRDLPARGALVLDPMLATGGSAIQAIHRVKQAGATLIRFACVVAAPEGLAAFRAAHPDVPVTAGALDERLNEKGYIVPGLGDAGDRCFGTE